MSCCNRDEGGPLGVVNQVKASNYPELHRSRVGVVSVMGKRQGYPCQVSVPETNGSEPLSKRRELQWCQNRGFGNTPGSVGRVPEFWSDGIRRRGGVTGTQARLRNMGTCRLDAKGAIQALPRKDVSTDARHRGGVMRSSDEGTVMVLERRHDLVRFGFDGQL